MNGEVFKWRAIAKIAFATTFLLLIGREAALAQTMERRDGVPADQRQSEPALMIDGNVEGKISLPIFSDSQSLVASSPPSDKVSMSVGRSPSDYGVSDKFDVPAGRSSFTLEVTSNGAAHLRLGLEFARSGSYRVTTWSPESREQRASVDFVHGVSSSDIDWSALVDGATAILQIDRIDGATEPWGFRVTKIAHFLNNIGSQPTGIKPRAFGDAAYCQIDAVCALDAAPLSIRDSALIASRSVAMLMTTDSIGNTYFCTGTLLNTDYYPSPILLTANHCIDNANSLLAIWFYSKSTCGATTPGPYLQTTGGATILYASAPYDAALLRLAKLPPSEVPYTGWDAKQVTSTTPIVVFHHPRGDVKKASFGEIVGIRTTPITIGDYTYASNTFYMVDWDYGVVEHGSSGSSLYSLGAQYFYVRGTLTGGSATCSTQKSRTYYSELTNYYPDIKKFLVAEAPSNPVAVEYYHATFGHYFVTVLSDEITKLDNGTFVGWARTGYSFKVYPLGSSGTQSVCRFFSTAFSPKSSHFYTPSASECATVKNNPNWTYEGLVFGLAAPSATGTCGTGTIPLYRLYNNGQGAAPNHRYTTNTSVRSTMINQGWIPEGSGPLGVIGCVPS